LHFYAKFFINRAVKSATLLGYSTCSFLPVLRVVVGLVRSRTHLLLTNCAATPFRQLTMTAITRNSSEDEIANVNLYEDDIVHEFGEITQNKGHYTIQGHSRSPILVPIESSYTTSYQ